KVTMRLLDPSVQPQKSDSDSAPGAPAPTTSESRINFRGESSRAVEVPTKDRGRNGDSSLPKDAPPVENVGLRMNWNGWNASLPKDAPPVGNRPAENGPRHGGGPPTQIPRMDKPGQ